MTERIPFFAKEISVEGGFSVTIDDLCRKTSVRTFESFLFYIPLEEAEAILHRLTALAASGAGLSAGEKENLLKKIDILIWFREEELRRF